MLLHPLFFITLIFCILSYAMYFFKFSIPTQNTEFYIHQSYIEIGLSIKKMIKRHTSCLKEN